ncbi:DHA2 family efflux MFS transporter permease subunit [Pseudonocardia sp. TRM90224]|uniref:DHA2 family efflux MFS transporter permease subunit n=1 Tax=Pseudonocardia sp. TRM90224 TaxID=2812678 RepID=UPI001E374F2F|nr:DHA2 family efflux MFS transporter permease subunit [Pseudonocardia sp. TRM90224]
MTAGRRSFAVAVLVTSLPTFMATLDNLVVTTALPVIRTQLSASLETLQWVVNAYTLAFAALLLTAAALGDRLGRRKVFAGGGALFTVASAACAVAPDATWLIAARAVQGAAAAAIMALALPLLAAAVPVERRAVAIGIWGGVNGLGVALGPLVGGAVVQGLNWEWIFWLNVPFGLVAVPLALGVLRESHGPDAALDLLGLLLSGGGVLAVVWAVVRADALGWTATPTVLALVGGAALLAAFIAWQRRAAAPLVPLGLYRSSGFAAANIASGAFSFGMFGAVFLLAQFFQVAQGATPLEPGLRTMPWTLAPMFVAPLAGMLANRVGTRVLATGGLGLQAVSLVWIAAVLSVDMPYIALVPAFLLAGIGLGATFAPLATAVLAVVPPEAHGKAAGVNGTVREVGVALGVAVLTAVFSSAGSYTSGADYIAGLVPAVWTGAVVVALGTVAALRLPRPARTPAPVAVTA